MVKTPPIALVIARAEMSRRLSSACTWKQDYAVVDGPSWTSAEDNAQKLGGNLITISDERENELAQQMPMQSTNQTGLSDEKAEGIWEWSSGETSNYRTEPQ